MNIHLSPEAYVRALGQEGPATCYLCDSKFPCGEVQYAFGKELCPDCFPPSSVVGLIDENGDRTAQICAWCDNRAEGEAWAKKQDAATSHGICGPCAIRFRQDAKSYPFSRWACDRI